MICLCLKYIFYLQKQKKGVANYVIYHVQGNHFILSQLSTIETEEIFKSVDKTLY